ncbi:MAG: hypothetical protein PHW24_03095, partial [Candidatus Moranbacteria bacterium]|nr:hypothetical protein [Candidatus Moranbacteria bacterium]
SPCNNLVEKVYRDGYNGTDLFATYDHNAMGRGCFGYEVWMPDAYGVPGGSQYCPAGWAPQLSLVGESCFYQSSCSGGTYECYNDESGNHCYWTGWSDHTELIHNRQQCKQVQSLGACNPGDTLSPDKKTCSYPAPAPTWSCSNVCSNLYNNTQAAFTSTNSSCTAPTGPVSYSLNCNCGTDPSKTDLASIDSSSCTACTASNDQSNGICGVANGQSFSTVPSSPALCSVGLASPVTGTGPWNWTCSGSNGGTNASCSANKGFLLKVDAGNNTTITDSSGLGINIFNATTQLVITSGTSVKLSATATPPPSVLQNWTGDICSGQATIPCSFNMDKDYTVGAFASTPPPPPTGTCGNCATIPCGQSCTKADCTTDLTGGTKDCNSLKITGWKEVQP